MKLPSAAVTYLSLTLASLVCGDVAAHASPSRSSSSTSSAVVAESQSRRSVQDDVAAFPESITCLLTGDAATTCCPNLATQTPSTDGDAVCTLLGCLNMDNDVLEIQDGCVCTDISVACEGVALFTDMVPNLTEACGSATTCCVDEGTTTTNNAWDECISTVTVPDFSSFLPADAADATTTTITTVETDMTDMDTTTTPATVSEQDVSISTAATAVGGTEMSPELMTIVELGTMDPNFSTLVAAVTAAGLVETLSGEGPFTLFAPNNDAFAALPDDTVTNLLQPENLEMLQNILKYHVVEGTYLSTTIVEDLMPVITLLTLNGEYLNVTITDTGVMINDANVIESDIEASNGFIHVIDKVLLPDTNDSTTTELTEGGGGDTVAASTQAPPGTTTTTTMEVSPETTTTAPPPPTTMTEDPAAVANGNSSIQFTSLGVIVLSFLIGLLLAEAVVLV